MKRVVPALILLLLFATNLLAAEDLTGKWSGTLLMAMEGKEQKGPMLLVLKQTGGTFTGGGELVGDNGFWAPVAAVDDVPPGTAVRFSTAAFDGFVVNDGGDVRALSSVCTHMGCTLQYRPQWQDLRCPCHGASFDLSGQLANGRRTWRENPYRGDAQAYPIQLPDLVRPRVKVEDGVILVWTSQA